MLSPWPSFSFQLKTKMTGNCCVFKFLPRNVNGKNLMRFHSETSGVVFWDSVVYSSGEVWALQTYSAISTFHCDERNFQAQRQSSIVEFRIFCKSC